MTRNIEPSELRRQLGLPPAPERPPNYKPRDPEEVKQEQERLIKALLENLNRNVLNDVLTP